MTIIATRTAPNTTSRSSSGRARLRDLVGPVGAVATILFANLMSAAGDPMPALFFAGCMIVCAIAAMSIAGPRRVTLSMSLAPAIFMAWALAGFFGPLHIAGPDLAVIVAGLAAWTIGYLGARNRSTQNLLWSSLVWSLLLYSMWVFFTQIGSTFGAAGSDSLIAGLGSATDAGVLFGLFALVGSARVMHVIKEMDAAALSRSEMVDRLLRDGLGGTLLVGFALTCLALTGSRVGILLAIAAIVFHSWWDLRFILRREHRSTWVQVLEKLTPLATLGAVGLAFFLAFFHDESVATPTPGAAENTHLQRLEVYWAAVTNKPVFGHGLGQIQSVAERTVDLHSYVALSAPGDARNLFVNWLVEAGYLGLGLAALALLLAHVMLIRVFRERVAPRSLPRLALMSSLFLLLHGTADSSLALPTLVWTYALILGCACGVAALHNRKNETPAA